MPIKQPYREKFARIAPQTLFGVLSDEDQIYIQQQASRYRFTQQELRQLCEIAKDMSDWNAGSIVEMWPVPETGQCAVADPRTKSRVLNLLAQRRDELRRSLPVYGDGQAASIHELGKPDLMFCAKPKLGFGPCPVASEKTRCCNLLTLDAIDNCGFSCSYCSIQCFYHNDEVRFDLRFEEKLKNLRLDPNRVYHIGTGQSSDSLMWGNKNGVMDALIEFARHHPNVILELKSKSKNIAHLLKTTIPPNMVCSWSLNTPCIIEHEERRTATLEDRLRAARKLADRGILVGFHLHPMIHYQGWREHYAGVIGRVQELFDPREVVMVSFGTLTFTKQVINQIRARTEGSRVLQMPMLETNGKFSYPNSVKVELFRHAYDCFAPWHDKLFFFLCMENPELWRPTFGREYGSNEAFEADMLASYLNKIRAHQPSLM